LTQYFDGVHALETAVQTGTSARAQALWANQVQKEVATCMKEAGFTYYPLEFDDSVPVPLDATTLLEGDLLPVPDLPDTIEEVRQNGYGVNPQGNESGDVGDPTDLSVSEEETKNLEYFDGLTGSAQAAYEEALSGWDGTEEWLESGRVGGCSAAAAQKYPKPEANDDASKAWELHGDVIGGLRALVRSQIPQDEVVTRLDLDWQACMLGRGYELDTGPGAGDGFSPYRLPTLALMRATQTGSDGSVLDPATAPENVPADQMRLTGSEAEVQVAVADFECRQQTNYLNTYLARVREMQEEFIRNNRDELERFKAAVEQLGL
jgi:hypothetical protein